MTEQDHQQEPNMGTKKERLALSFVQFTQYLSPKMAWWFSGFFAWLAWILPNDLRVTTIENIDLAYPEFSTKDKSRLVYLSLRHTFSLALESGTVWIQPLDYGIAAIREIRGLEILTNYTDKLAKIESQPDSDTKTTGLILLLPHLGNWEMANQFIAPRAKVVALYKPHKNQLLDQLIREARMRAGIEMVPTSRSGVAKILRHLKSGGITIILPDQVPDSKSGLNAEFFGQKAFTGTLVPKLAQSTAAEIAGLCCLRNKDGSFDIELHKGLKDFHQLETQEAVNRMNQFVEKMIRPHSEQYQWSYKRFKQPK